MMVGKYKKNWDFQFNGSTDNPIVKLLQDILWLEKFSSVHIFQRGRKVTMTFTCKLSQS